MKSIVRFIILFAVLLAAYQADAQCAMCKATAETSLGAGSSAAEGLNKGILYLFMTPYILIGIIGYFWWRARKRALTE
ncbi:MAG: hypothetical protein NZM35_11715 [Chitinophagales bacterium]|nr:hypothetical protein [Chitinophagales bacterium]MDW8419254.1 hypothetical protein [Chitinophagales bacterium]